MSIVTRRIYNRKPVTIKAALCKAGFPTVTALAVHLGRSRSLVSQVISGDTKSSAVAGSIAALIGKMPAELWPRLYAADASVPESQPLAS